MSFDDGTWFTPGGAPGMGFRDDTPVELGGWRVEHPIGEGGFGRVFLAKKDNQRAALKALRPDWVTLPQANAFRQSFESELTILNSLSGPHTARLVDADLSSNTPWIATRFIAGDTLADQVRYDNPVRGDAWWRVAYGLFSGLAEAHDLGIIHRDVKPSNVMRSIDVPAILIDFGIGVLVNDPSQWDRAGTDRFSSPEQRAGDPLTPATDIYSAALTLLYITTRPQTVERNEFTKLQPPGVPFVEDIFDRDSTEAEFLHTALSREPDARPPATELAQFAKDVSELTREAPRKFNMAIPSAPMSAPAPMPRMAGPAMSHGIPEAFSLSLPPRPPSWAKVTRELVRLLDVPAGSVATARWWDADISAQVFGIGSGQELIELVLGRGVDRESVRETLVKLGWSEPGEGEAGGWVQVTRASLRHGQSAASHLINALQDMGIAPEIPEAN